MIIAEIREELKRLQDVKYRDFQIPIIPTVKPESMIGVRTPELRKLASNTVPRRRSGLFWKICLICILRRTSCMRSSSPG